jgi:cyclic pyranopterin phosphate synthase
MSEIKPFTGVDDRVWLYDAVPLATPFTFNIFPTNLCNFRCSYCAQSLGREKLIEKYNFFPESMSVETIQRAVEQAKGFPDKFKLVSFMGHGEPLVNQHLPEMISIVKSAGIANRIDVITNGSLLTKERSKKLIESGLDVIRISLQGISSTSYKNISSVSIDFEEFIENLAYLYNNKKQCKVFVKTMDVSLEGDETERFYKLFSNISDRMYIDKVKPVYNGVDYSGADVDLSVDRYGNKHEKRKVCPQPFYMLSLWPNGDVTPCDALYKACNLGNIRDNTLVGMWQSAAHKEFCVLQLKGQRHLHGACKLCCAPDDVAHEEDVLDGHEEKIFERLL